MSRWYRSVFVDSRDSDGKDWRCPCGSFDHQSCYLDADTHVIVCRACAKQGPSIDRESMAVVTDLGGWSREVVPDPGSQ